MTAVDVQGDELGVRAKWLRRRRGRGRAPRVRRAGLAVGRRCGAPAGRPAARAARHHACSAFVVFALGSVFTARRVTDAAARARRPRPSASAAATTRRRCGGLQRDDEIGELAQSFERMRIERRREAGADPAARVLGQPDRAAEPGAVPRGGARRDRQRAAPGGAVVGRSCSTWTASSTSTTCSATASATCCWRASPSG